MRRAVDKRPQRGVKRRRCVKAAQLAQRHIRIKGPRASRELSKQQRAPDATAGQHRQHRLQSADQAHRGSHRSAEDAALTRGPEPSRVKRHGRSDPPATSQLEHQPGAHRAPNHVDPIEIVHREKPFESVR